MWSSISLGGWDLILAPKRRFYFLLLTNSFSIFLVSDFHRGTGASVFHARGLRANAGEAPEAETHQAHHHHRDQPPRFRQRRQQKVQGEAQDQVACFVVQQVGAAVYEQPRAERESDGVALRDARPVASAPGGARDGSEGSATRAARIHDTAAGERRRRENAARLENSSSSPGQIVLFRVFSHHHCFTCHNVPVNVMDSLA